MQTRKNANLAPESFRHSAVPRRLKHRARRRRRILCLLPVILVFGVLAAALLRFTPALTYADIFPAQATTRRIKDVPYISQLPTLPTGCESACAAMLLNYYGCTVTAEEFASYYLPTGDAPHTDENGYYFSDPLAGQDIYYGKDSVEVAYTALFEQAIILTN